MSQFKQFLKNSASLYDFILTGFHTVSNTLYQISLSQKAHFEPRLSEIQ